jgi:branched-chain amino acid transport system ATP-binding protein
VVAVLGPNGAGKTTLIRVAAGTVKPTSGRIAVNGQDATKWPAHVRAQRGVCHIPEGRGIFPSLTVRENIMLASIKGRERESVERVADMLPALAERLRQVAGSLSGGEQQMLAISRALIRDPSVVAVDEASLGLSPIMVDTIFELLRKIVETGTSVLLVEQYVSRALAFADHVYLVSRGTVVMSRSASEIQDDDIFAEYIGQGAPPPVEVD